MLDNIKKPVAHEMSVFEKKFKDSMKSSVPLLDKITHYIVKRKGKQIRPLFVLLSAKLNGGVNEVSYTAAGLIELLHTATLVHDDVVDDSHVRRGFFSLNALWKNKIAVLVGDYLLSKGLLLAIEKKEYRLLEITSKAVKEMSEGELRQMEKSRNLNLEEDVYFKIIEQKTASLIAACCESGAYSAGSSAEACEIMYQFGIKTGLAFQIKDDLFDFGIGQNIGKPTGIDIKEKKITLPLIYALNKASKKEKSEIIGIVKSKKIDKQKVLQILNFVEKNEGIAYAHKKMHELKNEAILLLHKLPQNEARDSLEILVNFTIDRNK